MVRNTGRKLEKRVTKAKGYISKSKVYKRKVKYEKKSGFCNDV